MNHSFQGVVYSIQYSIDRDPNRCVAEPHPAPSGGRGKANLGRVPASSGGPCQARLNCLVPSNGRTSYPVSRAEIASVQKPANPATAPPKRREEADFGLKTTQRRRSTDPNPIPEALQHVLQHMHTLDRPAIFHTEEQGHKRREGRILRESTPSVADRPSHAGIHGDGNPPGRSREDNKLKRRDAASRRGGDRLRQGRASCGRRSPRRNCTVE